MFRRKAQEAQAKYEKKLVYRISEQIPLIKPDFKKIEHNKRQIDEHSARMLRKKKERILKEEKRQRKDSDAQSARQQRRF